MSRQWQWAILTGILLLAAAMRLVALGQVPPGLAHDEVANWLIAQDILSGKHTIYFTAAYGHEPLYQYVQAATVGLFGDHWLGLRWPSFAFGLLGIVAIYALMRRLFGAPVALLTITWLTVSFWPLFYARVGLRAITLPLTAALSAYFLCHAPNQPASPTTHQASGASTRQLANALLAGLFLGLSLYTYMAARILPFIFVTFLVYSMLVSSSRLDVRWSHLLVLFLVALLVSIPLVIWLATHPGAEYRISEIREPLDRLLAGDPTLVWQNLIANLKSFTIAGDPWPHQNLPGRPVFADPIGAVLFYAGVGIALWRWHDPRYGFLLIWLIGALGPSVATSVAPSSIRNILGLVVVFAFPAIALAEAGRWFKGEVQGVANRIQRWPFFLVASCFLLLTPCLLLTGRDYFVRWPRNEDVRYFYQTDLTAVAHRLDERSPGTPAVVAGLSVHTMDRPTLQLTASERVDDVRLCDTRETLVLPASARNEGRLFVPRIVPFDPDLEQRLLKWGADLATYQNGAFITYRLPDRTSLERNLELLADEAALPDGSVVELPASFGGHLVFLGYEWLQSNGGTLKLLTYWRVEDPPSTRLKIFVHLVDETGHQVGQHDGLGSPPQGWAPGDLVVQKHFIASSEPVAPGLFSPQVGLYNPSSGSRLSVAGFERLSLSPDEAKAP